MFFLSSCVSATSPQRLLRLPLPSFLMLSFLCLVFLFPFFILTPYVPLQPQLFLPFSLETEFKSLKQIRMLLSKQWMRKQIICCRNYSYCSSYGDEYSIRASTEKKQKVFWMWLSLPSSNWKR